MCNSCLKSRSTSSRIGEVGGEEDIKLISYPIAPNLPRMRKHWCNDAGVRLEEVWLVLVNVWLAFQINRNNEQSRSG